MLESYLWFITKNWLSVITSLIIIMIILNYTTWKLEEQISIIWKKLKLPNSVRWAIFDASISSLPELLTAVIWLIILWAKWLEVWSWTIWWSALFNILIIPASVLIFAPKNEKIKIDNKWIKRDSIFYIISIIIFIIWLKYDQLLIMSLILIWLYVIYIFNLYKQSLAHKKENEKEIEKNYNSVKDKKIKYIQIIIALIFTYVLIEAAVLCAKRIWIQLNIEHLIISLIILAWVTSIPDTLLSIKSAKKWDVNAGLSNAVWSNIFNICIWLALPIFIWTYFMGLNLEFDFKSNFILFLFAIFASIVYFIILHIKNLNKKYWIIFILFYIISISYLIF